MLVARRGKQYTKCTEDTGIYKSIDAEFGVLVIWNKVVQYFHNLAPNKMWE